MQRSIGEFAVSAGAHLHCMSFDTTLFRTGSGFILVSHSFWELARVRKTSALVIGAGALGNEVCRNLAMIGVRLIVGLHRDIVEAANLSRSIFFRESDHLSPR